MEGVLLKSPSKGPSLELDDDAVESASLPVGASRGPSKDHRMGTLNLPTCNNDYIRVMDAI